MRGRPQPARQQALQQARLHLAHHPLAETLLTSLRDIRTPPAQFARAVAELTRHLLWLALAGEPSHPVEVPGHSGGPVRGAALSTRLAGLVILRAGLGMAAPLRDLLPAVPVYQIGIRRDEKTLQPEVYYQNLPSDPSQIDHLLLLDPMLATGGSAAAALTLLRQSYRGPISFLGLIGAPIGVERVVAADPDIEIWLAALDERLDDRGFIVPGLGDAGDRLFGTA